MRYKTLLVAAIIFLQSCGYSVIVYSKHGVFQPDPNNHSLGFYNGKEVHIIDTVVPLSLLQNGTAFAVDSTNRVDLYSVEYRVGFGAILRNTFSFGKRRTVKIKYVFAKNQN